MKKEITLYEALAGTKFVVTHLDGHKVVVASKPGEVIAPDSIRQVPDEGMPVYGHSQVKGALFVQFDVKFPEHVELTEAMRKVLAGILPAPKEAVSKADLAACPVKEMEEMDMEARKARERLAKDAYDSDEEGAGGRGGPQVQCAQQ